MTELSTTIVELVAALAAADPRSARFGAASHRWRCRPPLPPARVAAIEAAIGHALPADYRTYLVEVGDGGAGPYHGILPVDHPDQLAFAGGTCPLPGAPAQVPGPGSPWRGAVAVADLGCDQVALLVVAGPARGSVWADARAVGAGCLPLAPSFTDFLGGGLAAAARGELPPALAPPSACAIPRALSAVLARAEAERGLPAGALAGDDLRAALAELGAGSIAIGSLGTPIHARGERIAPCIQCAALLENLRGQGLAPGVLVAADPPRMLRPGADVRPLG